MNTSTMMCTFFAHSERVGARMRKKFVLPLRLRKTLTTKLSDLSLSIHTYINTSWTHIRVSTNKFTTHLVLDQVCLTYYTRGPVVSKLGTNGHLLAKLRLDHQTVQNTHKQIQTLENHWPITDTELNKANFSTLEVIMLDLLATWARVEGSPAAPVSPLCLSRLDDLLSPCSVGIHILRAHHSIPAAQTHNILTSIIISHTSNTGCCHQCSATGSHTGAGYSHANIIAVIRRTYGKSIVIYWSMILWANLHEAFIDVLILSRVLSFCSFFTFQTALILSKSILRWTILM